MPLQDAAGVFTMRKHRFVFGIVAVLGGLLASVSQAAEVSNEYSVSPSTPLDEALGLRLPPGFEATVFADVEGYARHVAVRSDGTVYLALTVRMGQGSNMGVVAMRDTDGDRIADEIEQFARDIPATELVFFEDDLYVGANTAIYRFSFAGDELVPASNPEVVVSGFPEQRLHEAKTFAIDRAGNLYVNVGAPSNACMVEFRTRGSPGQRPCPQLERQGGIWRYDARASNQTQADDGERYATGVRNAVAIEYDAVRDQVYFLSHGRDAFYTLFPEYYTAEQSAELPSEEMHALVGGANYGWPYTYYDHIQGKRLVAPEYGGDSTAVPEQGLYVEPLATFPGHWAPNDLMFYTGAQLPAHYRGGAFIVFHGSWNRAPLPQDGYKIVYRPFVDGRPGPDWEVFADGFKGADVLANPADAVHRPMSIAQGAEGELYVSSTVSGRVWRIDYVGR
jgi:glucose/arabinose dehydrogenase